jgi:P pilus assembly chaperone PapD
MDSPVRSNSRIASILASGALPLLAFLLSARPLGAQAPAKPAPVPVKAAVTTSAAPTGGGAGDLLVAPTRVVLEGRVRTAEIALVNKGTGSAVYRVSLVHMRMDENGGMKEIETPGPGEKFADDLVRYAPREVTLEPGGAQTVRIQARIPADLAPGEYRSHLLFRAVPPAVAPSEETKEMKIELRPIYGVSIPLIVRHGDVVGTATLAALAVLPAKPATAEVPTAAPPMLHVRIDRSGTASVFGNFIVTFTPNAGGKPVGVGIVNGVAVYTPNTSRAIDIALNAPPGTVLQHGTLSVRFSKTESAADTLAEGVLTLP